MLSMVIPFCTLDFLHPIRGNALLSTAQRTALALPGLWSDHIGDDIRDRALKYSPQRQARPVSGLYNAHRKTQADYLRVLEARTEYNRGVHRSCHVLRLPLLPGL